MNKDEHFNLPKIDKFDESFKEKKFDKEMALFLVGEIQKHWCEDCDNYETNNCGCFLPPFKKEMIRKINEHFDNPPLKFEEIKKLAVESTEESVVIYDNVDKCYIKLYLDYEGVLYYFNFGNECDNLFVFEDNRFYRREVIDEGS